MLASPSIGPVSVLLGIGISLNFYQIHLFLPVIFLSSRALNLEEVHRKHRKRQIFEGRKEPPRTLELLVYFSKKKSGMVEPEALESAADVEDVFPETPTPAISDAGRNWSAPATILLIQAWKTEANEGRAPTRKHLM